MIGYAEGGEAAFAASLDGLRDSLLRYGESMGMRIQDAEDAYQNACVGVWNHWRRGNVDAGGKVRGLLYAAFRNAAADQYNRKRSRWGFFPGEAVWDVPDYQDPAMVVEAREFESLVLAEMGKLGEGYGRALRLYMENPRGGRENGREMGIGHLPFTWRTHRGRTLLRRRLEERGLL